MNQVLLGATIASLRKQKHMTQAKLAEALDVSYKTISKWETGLGYPEISILPRLASVLGVTVDYLLTGERYGIAIAGNLHWDTVQYLDADFRSALLGNVTSVSQDVGGCVPSIALNLAKIDPVIPLVAIGCVGTDENGRRVLTRLQRHYIQTSSVTPANAATGTNTLLIEPSGERFEIRNANANTLFDPTNIDVSSLNCRIFHFDRMYLPGYWEPDQEYGCKLARALHDLQEAGILTSISAAYCRFLPTMEQLSAVLRYCDHLIIDYIWLKKFPDGDSPEGGTSDLKQLLQKFLDLGVREKVSVLESYFRSACLSKNGRFTTVHMPEIRDEDVVSFKGFSDDICAGYLYGTYQGYSDREVMEFALAAAAIGLTKKKTADGMRPKKDIQQYIARAREKHSPM